MQDFYHQQSVSAGSCFQVARSPCAKLGEVAKGLQSVTSSAQAGLHGFLGAGKESQWGGGGGSVYIHIYIHIYIYVYPFYAHLSHTSQ